MGDLLAQLTPQLQAEGGEARRRPPPPPGRFDDHAARAARTSPGARPDGHRAPHFHFRCRRRALVRPARRAAHDRARGPGRRQAGGVDPPAPAGAVGMAPTLRPSLFLREQVRDIVLVACAMALVSILLAVWLARHLLRPVAALRDVAARLAQGQFDARAPLLSRDELAELALHVNSMAEALEASERHRRKMLADVAHELRTPLTVIRGEIEALIDGIRKADPAALVSLHAEVLHLNKLVDDLHQLTLADAGMTCISNGSGSNWAPCWRRWRRATAGTGPRLPASPLDAVLSPQPLCVRADPGVG
ncbi:HAMP domain-containing protein [Massilia sp. H-1]|nr:HAMP domain-containing protein [Massilia sp. H-1]